jgi:hypothetical protein
MDKGCMNSNSEQYHKKWEERNGGKITIRPMLLNTQIAQFLLLINFIYSLSTLSTNIYKDYFFVLVVLGLLV